jgi:hypothetical protein
VHPAATAASTTTSAAATTATTAIDADAMLVDAVAELGTTANCEHTDGEQLPGHDPVVAIVSAGENWD